MKRTLLTFFSVCLLAAASGQSVTFKDVAPIIRSKCATCHKPGQTGPFSLITYEDVAKRASFIKDVMAAAICRPGEPTTSMCTLPTTGA